MDIKEKLAGILRERNWSYYRLAKESEMSWSTIRNMFERGTEPTLPTLEAICCGLGITLTDLLTDGNAVELTGEQREILENWEKLDLEDKKLYKALLQSLNQKKK